MLQANGQFSALKVHLTFEEQLQRLKDRGLSVADDGRALAALRRIGYYRLAGYFYPLRKTLPRGTPGRADEFQSGASFELVLAAYEFDKQLRLCLLSAAERIEVALRVDIAYRLGKRHRFAHECPHELDGRFATHIVRRTGRTAHQEWLARFRASVLKAKRDDFVVHHVNKYGGRMPIWVATELWDFGMLSQFFAGMAFKDQRYIASGYGLREAQHFPSWLKLINFARNVAAHHGRFWNRTVPAIPSFPAYAPEHPLHHLASEENAFTRMYAAFAVSRFLLRTISPNDHEWSESLRATMDRFPASKLWSLRSAGFPDNWGAYALWI